MRKKEGSLTVEASLVVPLFILCIVTLIGIVVWFQKAEVIQLRLSETARIVSIGGYIKDKNVDAQNENDDIVALIKPQFEAGKDEVGKKGIVKDPKTHLKVIENVITYANECHLSLQALSFSPITGGEGNIEFLAHFKVGGVNNPIDIENVVNEAHICFKG